MKRIRSYFLCVCCAVSVIAITPVGTGRCASAQTASTNLSFEVATIKPIIRDASHPFDPTHFWAHVYQTRASYWSMTLESLITYAYDVQHFRVTGPGWADAEQFDIEARFPKDARKGDDRKMLQALLRDRFKLAFHVEKRELEGNVLVVGKHGPKLKPSLPDPAKLETDASSKSVDSDVGEGHVKSKIARNLDGSSTVDMGKRGAQTVKFDQENWAMHYELSKMTMEELAGRLSGCLGKGMHKVEDQTGIKGDFQVAYDCPMGTPRPVIGRDAADTLPSDPQGGGSLERSLDALGLKLEKRKMLLDVYVIDHAEKPSEE